MRWKGSGREDLHEIFRCCSARARVEWSACFVRRPVQSEGRGSDVCFGTDVLSYRKFFLGASDQLSVLEVEKDWAWLGVRDERIVLRFRILLGVAREFER